MLSAVSQDVQIRFWNSFESCDPELPEFLERATSNPFLHHGWLDACWNLRQREGGARLEFAGVYRDGRLITFAPFCAVRGFAGRIVLTLLGEGPANYLGFAGETTGATVHLLLSALSAKYPAAIFRFTDIVESDPLHSILPASNHFSTVRTFSLYPCPWRDTANADPASSHLRKELKRCLRRVTALGEIQTRVLDFDNAKQEALEFLPAMFSLHRMRFLGDLNPWLDRTMLEFLETIARSERKTGLRVFLTLLDEVPVAFVLGFLDGDSFCDYITAFHPALARYNLGHICIKQSLDLCAGSGIRVFDFSKGDDVYKRKWASEVNNATLITGIARPGLLTRVVYHLGVLVLRLKLEGRERQWNRKIKAFLGKWKSRGQVLGGLPFHPSDRSDAFRARPFRFSEVASLPPSDLARLLDFAFVKSDSEGPLILDRTKQMIRLTATGSGDVVSLPLT